MGDGRGKHMALPTEDPGLEREMLSRRRRTDDLNARASRLKAWSEEVRGSSQTGALHDDQPDLLKMVPDGGRELHWCSPAPLTQAPALAMTSDRKWLIVSTLLWFAIGLLAYTSGLVVRGADGRGLTVVQSVYLMGQIATTIGYGDLVPHDEFGRLFVSLHIVVCGLLIAGSFMEIVDYIADVQQAQLQSAIGGLFDDGSPETESCLKKNQRVILSTLCFLAGIATWTLFFSQTSCDFLRRRLPNSGPSVELLDHVCEDMLPHEALYFGVMTFTTLGFGNVVPKTPGGQLFSFIGGFLGIATYLNLVGAVGESWLSAKSKMHVEAMTAQDIKAADLGGDGEVDVYEFTRFILRRYDVVPEDVLNSIQRNFSDLDLDGSGNITTEDMASMFDRKSPAAGVPRNAPAGTQVTPSDPESLAGTRQRAEKLNMRTAALQSFSLGARDPGPSPSSGDSTCSQSNRAGCTDASTPDMILTTVQDGPMTAGSSRELCWCASSQAQHDPSSRLPSLAISCPSSGGKKLLVASASVWFGVGLGAFTSGGIVSSGDGRGLTVTQSIYLMGQIATTVGYGDLVPTDKVGMYFICCYVLFCGVLIAGSLMDAAGSLGDSESLEIQSAIGGLLDDGNEETNSCLERNRPLIVATLCFLSALAVWTAFYSDVFCDFLRGHADSDGKRVWDIECEGMPLHTAAYFGIVTLTTTGFGDVVPKTPGGQIFSFFWGVIGIATYLNLVGAIAESWLSAKKKLQIQAMSAQDIELADRGNDGQVDLYEFTHFMLRRYELVTEEVLDNIKKNFLDLDADNSGHITIEDMASLLNDKASPPSNSRSR